MRTAALLSCLFGILIITATGEIGAQPVIKVDVKKADDKAAPKADEPFDQRKADLELIKSAGFTDDVKSLTDFYKSHTVTEADKTRLVALIKKLGSDNFEEREAASEELAKAGVGAIALLKSGLKDGDYEIVRRCDLALKTIEKIPTRSLAQAAARLLANHKDDTITEVLLNYLPLAEDDGVADEIRNSFAALVMRDGKADKILEATLENKDKLKRGAAAEAFARTKDKAAHTRIKEFIKKEAEGDIKMLVAVALVGEARDRAMISEMIAYIPDSSVEIAWRAEELLFRLAGEDGPVVAVGGDKAAREKARDEWKKWYEANEKKVDMAKLDDESSYNLTIVCETPLRGGLGRVVALGPDAKERWMVKNFNWPMDAVPLPGKKVLVAEHNRNRIIELDIATNKELSFETINQPCNVGRLPNGQFWAVGRNQIIEWERGDKSGRKQVFNFVRNEYDIVAGGRLKNGEYVVLTQNSQLLKIDRKGAVTKTHGVGGGNGINYYSTVDVLPNGKVLCTLVNSVTEYDIDSGKQGWSANFQWATSAVRLRNGNTLVGHQNNNRIVELDKDGKQTKWEYKGSDPAYRPFRAFKR